MHHSVDLDTPEPRIRPRSHCSPSQPNFQPNLCDLPCPLDRSSSRREKVSLFNPPKPSQHRPNPFHHSGILFVGSFIARLKTDQGLPTVSCGPWYGCRLHACATFASFIPDSNLMVYDMVGSGSDILGPFGHRFLDSFPPFVSL